MPYRRLHESGTCCCHVTSQSAWSRAGLAHRMINVPPCLVPDGSNCPVPSLPWLPHLAGPMQYFHSSPEHSIHLGIPPRCEFHIRDVVGGQFASFLFMSRFSLNLHHTMPLQRLVPDVGAGALEVYEEVVLHWQHAVGLSSIMGSKYLTVLPLLRSFIFRVLLLGVPSSSSFMSPEPWALALLCPGPQLLWTKAAQSCGPGASGPFGLFGDFCRCLTPMNPKGKVASEKSLGRWLFLFFRFLLLFLLAVTFAFAFGFASMILPPLLLSLAASSSATGGGSGGGLRHEAGEPQPTGVLKPECIQPRLIRLPQVLGNGGVVVDARLHVLSHSGRDFCVGLNNHHASVDARLFGPHHLFACHFCEPMRGVRVQA
mmetsp:Transcript_35490/g.75662  ORF Transcript_35490/g.75662 Transcript_35490/m.75662 type:complete len:371 (-) Transcript_35490:625-1737(-)